MMRRLRMMMSLVWHRYLRAPYVLHVYRQSSTPKARATLVFLHGIGNSGRTWDEVTVGLPDDVNILIVDLLGFGDSPQPDQAVYDAKTQSRALASTLLRRGILGNVILVGHSMGGLVAVDFAKRYPAVVKSLILCSPPLYNVDKTDDKKLFVQRDEQLRRLYELAIRKPKNIIMLSRLAKRYRLLNPEFDVDKLNVDNYIAALRANILNQTTTHDIVAIKKPITILYGTLDPFVIGQNIVRAQERSPYVRVSKYIGGHEIVGRTVKRVRDVIVTHLDDKLV